MNDIKGNKITLSHDLETALKGFMPIFGSQEDIWLLERLGKVKEKLRSIDCKAFRELERKNSRDLSPKMKEIQYDEKNLAFSITKRNFDF